MKDLHAPSIGEWEECWESISECVCVWLREVVISGVWAKAFLPNKDKLPCTGTG